MAEDVDDLDEAPELDEAWFAGVRSMMEVLSTAAHKAFKMGRPKAVVTKKQVTLRLDADLIDKFKATGPGWQTRINSALRTATQRGGLVKGSSALSKDVTRPKKGAIRSARS